MLDFELICCVVNHEKGSKVLRIGKKYGIKKGTIFLGKGTIKSKLLDVLDLNDSRKEIVLMAAEKETIHYATEHIAHEMAFQKRGHGIAFTIPVKKIINSKKFERNDTLNQKTEEESKMYHSIFTIVEKGLAEEVIEAANDAGAKGGTIINARGSGTDGMDVLFAMPIEPEKEIVMILSSSKTTEAISAAICERLHIDEPHNGIMFIIELSKTYGLY